MHISKTDILSQKPEVKERKLRLRWLIALSVLPFLGIYTAFGIAPQTVTNDIEIATVVEELALPSDLEITSPAPVASIYWQSDRIRRDDSVASVLKRLGVKNAEALKFLRQDAIAQQFTKALKAGRTVQAKTDEQGQLLALEYPLDVDALLTVKLVQGEYQAHVGAPDFTTRQVLKSAKIRSSLFAATDDAGIPDAIAIKFAEVFSSQIDFHEDLRKGDHLSVVYEADYRDGELVKTGNLVAAELVNNGKTYTAIYFQNDDDKPTYYTPDGKSINRSFLRSPLEFSRISSGFTMGRFHPILQRMRAHKGTDFAAPIGTGVKAPGDGVVDFVGVKSGYGNVIVLKHPNNVSTVYGHLSKFASGVRKGAKVNQGDLIGYVGMTGLATGPHLHYEFLVGQEHRDPMTVALPAAAPIEGHNRAKFMALANDVTDKFALLATSNTALLD
jgi:murein DD-endopeptidase MepM/ murein hydrolase activator NlpD